METASKITEDLYQKILSRIKTDLNIDYTIENRLESYGKNTFVKVDLTDSTGIDEDIFYINSYNITSVDKYIDLTGKYKIHIIFNDGQEIDIDYYDSDKRDEDYEKLYEYANKKFAIENIVQTISDTFSEDSDSDSDSESDVLIESSTDTKFKNVNNRYEGTYFYFTNTITRTIYGEEDGIETTTNYEFVFSKISDYSNNIITISGSMNRNSNQKIYLNLSNNNFYLSNTTNSDYLLEAETNSQLLCTSLISEIRSALYLRN